MKRLGAALLLLHALLATTAVAKKPRSPRGWQAAKEAEQRAAAAAAATADTWALGSPAELPDAGLQQPQPTCGSPWAVIERPLPIPVPWAVVAAVAMAAFAVGLLAGVALHAWLLGRRQRRKRPHPSSQLSQHEGAASCSMPPCEDEGEEAETRPLLPAERRLQPAGAVSGAAGPADEPAAQQQQQRKQQEKKTRDQEVAAPPAASAAAASALASAAAEAAASEAAAAAAIQELVLSQAASAGSEAESTGGGAAVADQQQAQALVTEQQQQQQQEQTEGGGELPLAAGAEAAAAPGGADPGHPLGLLRPEDRADIQAAAQLVLTMCGSMHVDPSQLSRGERLQLIYTMLQAWQAQQGRRHAEEMSRLGSHANLLRAQQLDVAVQQAARQAAKDAYRLSLERTAGFRRMCSDTLTFGLVVMVAAGTYQLLQRGLLASVTRTCGSPAALLGGRWGLWAMWQAAEALWCCALAVGDALLGLAVLLAAPWLVFRSGLLSDYHTMPVTKLFVGLGLVCGLAGYLAVGRLGGHGGAWLAAWEAWVALHVAFSAAAHRMQRIQLRAAQGGGGAAAAGAARMYEDGGGWLPAAMWVLLGAALPLLAGTLPFRWAA